MTPSARTRCPRLLAPPPAPIALALLLALAAAGADPLPAAAAFTLEAVDQPVQVVPPFATTPIRARLTHLGGAPATYTCLAFRNIPAAWFSSLCSETQCVFDSLDVLLVPGEVETLWVDVFPFGVPGSGTMELRVREHDAPFQSQSFHVGALSGVTRLVVDDDGGADYEDFAALALASGGITAGIWPAWIMSPPATDLGGFVSVYWLTGDATSGTLTAADRAALTTYLDGGGRLLVSGQGIGADIGGTAFYGSRLGATYVADQSGSTSVVGVAGDPIGDGLAFAIAGGTGANNQTSPDAIQARDHAVFEYGNGMGAGARVEGGGIYRTTYLPFGFEAIADEANRNLTIGRILTWLEATPPVGVPDAPGSRRARPTLLAAPNPSRGPTRFLGEQGLAGEPLTIRIADAMGRIVARVQAAPETGGNRIALPWDGRTLSGAIAPPGVYFFAVESAAGPGSATKGRLVIVR